MCICGCYEGLVKFKLAAQYPPFIGEKKGAKSGFVEAKTRCCTQIRAC